VVRVGEMSNAYTVLFREPIGKRLLWRSRHTCEDNTKMDLQEVRHKADNELLVSQKQGKF
jgi:hypothetical protein